MRGSFLAREHRLSVATGVYWKTFPSPGRRRSLESPWSKRRVRLPAATKDPLCLVGALSRQNGGSGRQHMRSSAGHEETPKAPGIWGTVHPNRTSALPERVACLPGAIASRSAERRVGKE